MQILPHVIPSPLILVKGTDKVKNVALRVSFNQEIAAIKVALMGKQSSFEGKMKLAVLIENSLSCFQ